MSPPPALLMIAHGTRDPAVTDEAAALCRLVAERIGAPAAMSWVESDLVEPSPPDAARALVDAGAESLVTLPLLAFAAGHAKSDVPEELARIDAALPGIPRRHGAVLGVHPALTELARRRVVQARERAGLTEAVGTGEALLVTGPGSSDPDANGDLAKAARFVAEITGHRWVEIGYAGVTWPTAEEALRRLHAAGFDPVVRLSWSLLVGVLEERVAEMAARVSADTGLTVVDAGRLGPAGELADAIADRYHQARHGEVRVNCDLCQFRLPLPGRQARAGMPGAGGTGEALHPEAARIQRARTDRADAADWKAV